MAGDTLQGELKRLKNLKNYRKLDEKQLEILARKNLFKKQISIGDRFSNKEDKKIAEDKLDAYITNYSIITYEDCQNVADLVYEELLKEKVQKQIEKIISDENSTFIPDKQISSMHDIEKRIWDLKEKIGISKDEKQDDLSALEELKKKFAQYIPYNRNEFTLMAGYKCSGCGKEDVQPLLLRRRVKNFDVLKHPHMSGRFWLNLRALEMVKAGLLTKEAYAWIFHTSPQYVSWCIEHLHDKIEIDNVEQESIQEYINSCPHLKIEKIPENILKEK